MAGLGIGATGFVDGVSESAIRAAAQRDAKLLNEKIDGAKSKLEGLLNRLPG